MTLTIMDINNSEKLILQHPFHIIKSGVLTMFDTQTTKAMVMT